MAIKVIVRKPAESQKKHIPLVYAFSPHHHKHLVAVHVLLAAGRDVQPPAATSVPFQDYLVIVGAVLLNPALPVAAGIYAGKIQIGGLARKMLGMWYPVNQLIKRTAAVTTVDVYGFSIIVS